MTIKDIWVGDIGTVFRATVLDNGVAADISSATTLNMHFVKPDGTAVQKTAVFYTDGSDGKVQYTTVSGDLNVAGVWSFYVSLVYSGGTRRTSYEEFTVWE